MSIIELKKINKSFGTNHVLKDISFAIEKGEVIAIIGSSGGGKSTLLRCLTFLEKIDNGVILLNDKEVVTTVKKRVRFIRKGNKTAPDEESFDIKYPKYVNKKTRKLIESRLESEREENSDIASISVQADGDETLSENLGKTKNNAPRAPKFVTATRPLWYKRRLDIDFAVYPKDKDLRRDLVKIGMVFQDFNLFPHLSVLKNLMLAPVLVSKLTKDEAEAIALENLRKVGLEEKRDAYPGELSGGQKQRVAIARALCMSPDILCFDEPTSALDPELTGEVLKVISGLRSTGVTMLIVTHEIMFAREVADKVIFMDGGIIEESGSAKDVIDNPQQARTKLFMQKVMTKG